MLAKKRSSAHRSLMLSLQAKVPALLPMQVASRTPRLSAKGRDMEGLQFSWDL